MVSKVLGEMISSENPNYLSSDPSSSIMPGLWGCLDISDYYYYFF